jgi:hypothetical protein
MALNYLSGWNGSGVMPRQISDILGATGNRTDTQRMLRIGEAAKQQGGSWGDAEFQRATAAGFSSDDVNAYLKWSGITPQGNFGVAGFNNEMQMGGSGDGAGLSTRQTPYYRYFGPTTAAPKPPAAAPSGPAAPASPKPLIQQPTDSLAVGGAPPLPEPRFQQGGAGSEIDSGAAAGFRRKKSSARIAGLTTKGTSQFKINGQSARSSGLNIGV